MQKNLVSNQNLLSLCCFGFNGQEKVDEVNGTFGSHNTAEFWEYDTRIGRRWNIDPITCPWLSPYACFNNNPIYFLDSISLLAGEPDNPSASAKKGESATNNIVFVSSCPPVEIKGRRTFWVRIKFAAKSTFDAWNSLHKYFLWPNVSAPCKFGRDGDVYQNQNMHNSIWPTLDLGAFYFNKDFFDVYSSSTWQYIKSFGQKRVRVDEVKSIGTDNYTRTNPPNYLPNATYPIPPEVTTDKDIEKKIEPDSFEIETSKTIHLQHGHFTTGNFRKWYKSGEALDPD